MSNMNTQITDMSTAAAKTVKDVTSTKKELDRHAKMIEMIASGMDQLRRDNKRVRGENRWLTVQIHESKIEKVPRGIRGEKSSTDMASSRNLVSTIGAQASPTMLDGTRCPEG